MISFDIERDLYKKDIIMVGVDEAGRGSCAGPLVSTACCFDFTKYKSLHSEINDIKNLDNFLQFKKLHLYNYSIEALVKGDSLSKTIALASIISKETRDNIMRQLSKKHPSYFFDSHFGYGTNNHKNAILKNGILDLHRKSFKPIATIYSKTN